MLRTITAFILGAVLATSISAIAQTDPCGGYGSGGYKSETYDQQYLTPKPGDSQNCFRYGTFVDCR